MCLRHVCLYCNCFLFFKTGPQNISKLVWSYLSEIQISKSSWLVVGERERESTESRNRERRVELLVVLTATKWNTKSKSVQGLNWTITSAGVAYWKSLWIVPALPTRIGNLSYIAFQFSQQHPVCNKQLWSTLWTTLSIHTLITYYP